jgi:DNA-binding transcriptional MerR regulator
VPELTIGELEEQSGVPRRTIYFYVQQGVLPPPNGAGLGARYGPEHVDRLRAIPALRARGWRLDRIREHFQRAGIGAAAETEETDGIGAPRRPGPAPPPAPLHPETLTRYHLAPGVDLHVEAAALRKDRERIRRLLDSAAAIFRDRDELHEWPHPRLSSEPTGPPGG